MLSLLTATVVSSAFGVPPLPTLTVDSHGVPFDDLTKILCDVTLEGDGVTWVGHAGMRWRGSSSIGYRKKSFAFETWDENGLDVTPDAPLLGMPIEEDWVLHGPYHDRTGLRDWFSHTVERRLGRWSPRGRYLTATINGEYVGLYVLFEKIKRDKFRVAVKKNENPLYVDNGYVFKMDKTDPDEAVVKTILDEFVFVYPTAPTEAQIDFLGHRLDDWLVSIEGGGDPVMGFPAHIDVLSFADEWILQTLAYNKDAFHTSSFFSKDIGGKIKAGPIWDFNLGYGDGLMSDEGIESWLPLTKPWWEDMMADPTFVATVIARWKALREGPLATDGLLQIIDDVIPHIASAAAIDFTAGGPWSDHVAHMKSWITRRLAWMDANIDALMPACTPDCAGRACGWDGCGGTCGACSGGRACEEGACVVPCERDGCELPPYYLYDDAPGPGITTQGERADFAATTTRVPGDKAILLDCDAQARAALMRRGELSGYDSIVLTMRADDAAQIDDVSLSVYEASTPLSAQVTSAWKDIVVPLDGGAFDDVAVSCRSAQGGGKVWVTTVALRSSLKACECDDDPLTTELCVGEVCAVVPADAGLEPGEWPELDYGAMVDPGPDPGPEAVESVEAGPEPTPEAEPERVEDVPDTGVASDTRDATDAEDGFDASDVSVDTREPDTATRPETGDAWQPPEQAEALPVPPGGCAGGAASSGIALAAFGLAGLAAHTRRRRGRAG